MRFNRIIIFIAVVGYFQITLRPAWIPIQGAYQLVNYANDWGGLFSETARQFFSTSWVLLAPAMFVAWTTFAMNLVLQALRVKLKSVPESRKESAVSWAFRMVDA